MAKKDPLHVLGGGVRHRNPPTDTHITAGQAAATLNLLGVQHEIVEGGGSSSGSSSRTASQTTRKTPTLGDQNTPQPSMPSSMPSSTSTPPSPLPPPSPPPSTKEMQNMAKGKLSFLTLSGNRMCNQLCMVDCIERLTCFSFFFFLSRRTLLRATHQFPAQEDNDLPLEKAQFVWGLERRGDWWFGETYSKDRPSSKGIFPGNYVELVEKSRLKVENMPTN